MGCSSSKAAKPLIDKTAPNSTSLSKTDENNNKPVSVKTKETSNNKPNTSNQTNINTGLIRKSMQASPDPSPRIGSNQSISSNDKIRNNTAVNNNEVCI